MTLHKGNNHKRKLRNASLSLLLFCALSCAKTLAKVSPWQWRQRFRFPMVSSHCQLPLLWPLNITITGKGKSLPWGQWKLPLRFALFQTFTAGWCEDWGRCRRCLFLIQILQRAMRCVGVGCGEWVSQFQSIPSVAHISSLWVHTKIPKISCSTSKKDSTPHQNHQTFWLWHDYPSKLILNITHSCK